MLHLPDAKEEDRARALRAQVRVQAVCGEPDDVRVGESRGTKMPDMPRGRALHPALLPVS